jgi:antitoxin YefM
MADVQFVTDKAGTRTAALVPIEEWERVQSEITSLQETIYLLQSETMRQRLMEARARTGGIGLEEARESLGV